MRTHTLIFAPTLFPCLRFLLLPHTGPERLHLSSSCDNGAKDYSLWIWILTPHPQPTAADTRACGKYTEGSAELRAGSEPPGAREEECFLVWLRLWNTCATFTGRLRACSCAVHAVSCDPSSGHSGSPGSSSAGRALPQASEWKESWLACASLTFLPGTGGKPGLQQPRSHL